MKKKLLFSASLALCLLLSNNASAQHNTCTPDDYTLVATVADTFSDNGVTKTTSIQSDNGTPYVTAKAKRENVEVMFQNCSFKDFTMNLQMSARYLKIILPSKPTNATTNVLQGKFYNFDRISSVPVTNFGGRDAFGNPVNSAAYNNLAAFCGGKNDDGTIKLNTENTTTADNYAGCGQDANGDYYVRRNVGSQLNFSYSLRFQNSDLDGTGTLAAGTSYIRVYHPTPKTWVITPEENSNPYTENGVIKNPCGTNKYCSVLLYNTKRGNKIPESYPSMPFVINLTSQNAYDYKYQ